MAVIRDVQNVSAIGGTAYLYVFDYVGSGQDPAYNPGHAEVNLDPPSLKNL